MRIFVAVNEDEDLPCLRKPVPEDYCLLPIVQIFPFRRSALVAVALQIFPFRRSALVAVARRSAPVAVIARRSALVAVALVARRSALVAVALVEKFCVVALIGAVALAVVALVAGVAPPSTIVALVAGVAPSTIVALVAVAPSTIVALIPTTSFIPTTRSATLVISLPPAPTAPFPRSSVPRPRRLVVVPALVGAVLRAPPHLEENPHL